MEVHIPITAQKELRLPNTDFQRLPFPNWAAVYLFWVLRSDVSPREIRTPRGNSAQIDDTFLVLIVES